MDNLHVTDFGTFHFRRTVTLKQLCDTFAEYAATFEELLKIDPNKKVLPIFGRVCLEDGTPHPNFPYLVRIFSPGPSGEPGSPILIAEKDGKFHSAVTPTRRFSEDEFKRLETIIGGPND
jgi:hypothetical protein